MLVFEISSDTYWYQFKQLESLLVFYYLLVMSNFSLIFLHLIKNKTSCQEILTEITK